MTRPGAKGQDGHVVVVGGGLGGLATALAVRQAGYAPIVIERAPGASEVDTGITLWSFAVLALRALGVEDVAVTGGAKFERLQSYRADGTLLSDIDLRPETARLAAPCIDIHRAELQAALVRALGEERLLYGSRCVSVGEDRAGAHARLEDGAQVRGELVVGADGIHSVARRHVAGPVANRAGGFGVWRGILPLDEALAPAGVHLRLYGPGAVFGVARLGGGRMRWYAGARLSKEPVGTRDGLHERFAGWVEPARSIIRASRGAELLFNDTPRAPTLTRWVRGRVALVGDAAHGAIPTLGVSGGLALADGLALGAALSRYGLTPAAALAYDAARRPIGRRIQREADLVGLVLGAQGRASVAVRDRLLSPPMVWVQRAITQQLMRGGRWGRR